MNPSRMLSVLTVATTVAIVSGCSKQEQTPAVTPPAASSAPAAAAAPTATPVPPSPTASEPAVTAQAQGMIDKAKSLVDSSQYADASKILQQLANMKLTPEQQKIVDDLKAVVQKQLAGQGASAVGGLLNK